MAAYKGVGNSTKGRNAGVGKRMSLRVLVASVDLKLRQNIYEDLNSDGCRVTEAQNGFEALYVAQLSEPFDIILLDTEVSKQDAIDATVQIRSLFGRKGSAPIVALVHSPSPTEYAYLLDVGFDEVMAKSTLPSNLLQRCKRAIVQKLAASEENTEGASSEPTWNLAYGLYDLGAA
ncbi:MAG: response regulator [Kordiimonas sp.]